MSVNFPNPLPLLIPFLLLAPSARGAEGVLKQLLPAQPEEVVKTVSRSSADVEFSLSTDPNAPGLLVTCKVGKEGYPGITLKPAAAPVFDLSAFGHVEARIVNTGAVPIGLTLRVDNEADYNATTLYLKPGESGPVRVRFGYTWGKPGYALRPAQVTRVLVFVSKGKSEQSFRIESVEAGGLPGEKADADPNQVRTTPPAGVLLGSGAAKIGPTRQIDSKNAELTLEEGVSTQTLRITFPGNPAGDQSVRLKPAVGRWNLRNYLELRVKLINEGKEAFAPRFRLDSTAGPTDSIVTASPIAPGAEAEVVIPFSRDSLWNGQPNQGTKFASDVVSALVVMADRADLPRSIRVTSIRADLPPLPKLPEWLGKRPPVEGDWQQTFSDDFQGSAPDPAKWNVKHPNYWDKPSHFSPQNVIVSDGVAKLRYEKKTGHQDDDPKQRTTDYATGYLDTMNHWTQRYGYFEARMKVPTSPGLWPAFWLMPDRGEGSKNRQATDNGGMEFDIFEHQTRWGIRRYNIAMHWDGYGKTHKSTGTEGLYVQPDKEGYITSGLLWTPGSAMYYCNGKEIARWENERVANVPALMMFTLPQGGWDNDDVDDSKLPDDFVIDYVRCWQRADLAKAP